MTSRLTRLGILGATVMACGSPAPIQAKTVPPAVVTAPATIDVRVTHPASDRFHVVYTLTTPQTRLDLQRNSSGVRAHWSPVDAKLEHIDADRDSIVASSPRTRFEVDLPIDDIQPEKDYRNFLGFSDGGRLLYTGHLAATRLPGTITFVGGPGESVVAHGVAPGPTVTLPMEVDGTYVYFGTAKPLATKDFVGMIDHGFPAAVQADLDSLLPELFKLYGDGLGRPAAASEKPLLFATYAKRGPGVSIGGGVMPPRVVNFNFEYADDPTPKWILERIDYTIAHEVAHLWNADVYQSPNGWIREGTADALAYATLRDMGRLDPKDYLGMLSNTVSLCATALAEGEWSPEAPRPGHFKELYFCGHTIALLSAAAANKPLVAFLKDVYAGPDNHYDENRYFEVLSARDAPTGALVRRIVTGKLSDPAHDLANAFTRVGVGVTPTDKAGGYYNQAVGGYALRAVVDPKCAASLQLDGDFGAEATVTAPNVCGDMQPGEAFDTFAKKGADAWDGAFAQCKKDGFVKVGRQGKPDAHVPCAKAPRARPQYLHVTNAP